MNTHTTLHLLIHISKCDKFKERATNEPMVLWWVHVTVTFYCIAWNFGGKKLSQNGGKYDFRWENFRRLLAFAVPKVPLPQILRRKLLQIATKPWNLQKISPSIFPLYSMSTAQAGKEKIKNMFQEHHCSGMLYNDTAMLSQTFYQLKK